MPMKSGLYIQATVNRCAAKAALVLGVIASVSLAGIAQAQNELATQRLSAEETITLSIIFVRGEVTLVNLSHALSPPAKGTVVRSGDVIYTGENGFVSLANSSGQSTVSVQPESQVVVGNIACASTTSQCVLTLDTTRGEIVSAASPDWELAPPTQFRINTPFAAAAVRGPSFDFESYLLK